MRTALSRSCSGTWFTMRNVTKARKLAKHTIKLLTVNIVPLALPTKIQCLVSFGSQAMEVMALLTGTLCNSVPVIGSQTITFPSSPPLARRSPRGEKARQVIVPECPHRSFSFAWKGWGDSDMGFVCFCKRMTLFSNKVCVMLLP